MAARRILIIQGHPDQAGDHFCHALGFVGVAPVKRSLIGLVEGKDGSRRTRWLAAIERLGTKAA